MGSRLATAMGVGERDPLGGGGQRAVIAVILVSRRERAVAMMTAMMVAPHASAWPWGWRKREPGGRPTRRAVEADTRIPGRQFGRSAMDR